MAVFGACFPTEPGSLASNKVADTAPAALSMTHNRDGDPNHILL